MSEIGEKIKDLRKKNGLTQEKLAESLCVSYQAISKWETGVTCPDIAMIVPLAKVFHVSTDQLLDYEDRRTDLEKMWKEALINGASHSKTLEITEAALKEYPHDQTFLYRRACDENFYADEITDMDQKRKYLERSAMHLKALIAEYPDFEAATGILVEVLVKLNRNEEATHYVQNQKDKDRLLKYCLTGEELHKHQQNLIYEALEKLFREMIQYNQPYSLQMVEKIINLVFCDGNYLWYYVWLISIYRSRIVNLIEEKQYDEAIDSLKIMLQYEKERKILKRKGILSYTTQIFDRLTFDPARFVSDPVADFLGVTDHRVFDAIRERDDFSELIKTCICESLKALFPALTIHPSKCDNADVAAVIKNPYGGENITIDYLSSEYSFHFASRNARYNNFNDLVKFIKAYTNGKIGAFEIYNNSISILSGDIELPQERILNSGDITGFLTELFVTFPEQMSVKAASAEQFGVRVTTWDGKSSMQAIYENRDGKISEIQKL